MPRIFDNIEQKLIDGLKSTLKISERADFCVGYFNLRGWRFIEELMESWRGGDEGCCRLMIGMQDKPEDEFRRLFSLRETQGIDQATAVRLTTRIAQNFREQLLVGAPSEKDLEGLRRLSEQLRAKRLVVKLFLRHKLHAKLYLLYNPSHPVTPIVGYVGSSNLTLAGLRQQGELNVDVVEYDACRKLEKWFNERWNERWCIDISEELANIIDESWAREKPISPYHIYLKIAYHLSEEARTGVLEFNIPRIFREKLFEYQKAAVKIAAHHLNKRGGVLIGDVVGLGKTLMATALARIMQEDYGMETLVICPKNLVRMWRDYMQDYGLVHEVVSVSNVQNELPNLRRFRVVIIDESHNLRNREGKRYKAIKDYIEKNESKCILLSATPYNKSYLDLSAQLRLFLSDEGSRDLGVRPERLLREIGETTFNSRYQAPVRSLTAFEQSAYADDWRDLMRLYLVRRTRSFIQDNYAQTDAASGRTYLVFSDGRRSYFPARVPRTVKFLVDETQASDPYAILYSERVVQIVNGLSLPRYGLANYIARSPKERPTPAEAKQLNNLSHAGKRLMGFCRTNLFKRLESGGPAFIQSIERHILRNFVYLHAIDAGLDLPLGTQDAALLDARANDEDEEALLPETAEENEGGTSTLDEIEMAVRLDSEATFRRRAAEVYAQYTGPLCRRFKWLRPTLFNAQLKKDLLADARNLLTVLDICGTWDANRDAKLAALYDLLTRQHRTKKC